MKINQEWLKQKEVNADGVRWFHDVGRLHDKFGKYVLDSTILRGGTWKDGVWEHGTWIDGTWEIR